MIMKFRACFNQTYFEETVTYFYQFPEITNAK